MLQLTSNPPSPARRYTGNELEYIAMNNLKSISRNWAESNSSPGVKGRDETYEMLIEVQAAAFEAGYIKAVDETQKIVLSLPDTEPMMRRLYHWKKWLNETAKTLLEWK